MPRAWSAGIVACAGPQHRSALSSARVGRSRWDLLGRAPYIAFPVVVPRNLRCVHPLRRPPYGR
eukprot:3267264-Lingulodinium_polyedra.AAC.1